MSNTVKVHLVDGSYSEWQAQASILQEHDELVRQGYGGKKLIHRLISGSICFPCKKSRFEIKQGHSVRSVGH